MIEDIKVLSRNIHKTVVEDGLLEIMMGIYLVFSYFFLVNRSLIFNFIFLPFITVIIEIVRKKFIYPRVGYAKIKLSAVQIISIFLILIVGYCITLLITAVVISGFGTAWGENWRNLLTFSLIVFTAVFFCGIAFRFKLPRWYFHGILLGILLLIGRFFKVTELVLALGSLMIIIGTVVFTRFLKSHPFNPEVPGEYSNAS
jgi:hypothetical protein